jgi:hypothetical protein
MMDVLKKTDHNGMAPTQMLIDVSAYFTQQDLFAECSSNLHRPQLSQHTMFANHKPECKIQARQSLTGTVFCRR